MTGCQIASAEVPSFHHWERSPEWLPQPAIDPWMRSVLEADFLSTVKVVIVIGDAPMAMRAQSFLIVTFRIFPEVAEVCTVPSGNLNPQDVDSTVPATESVCAGVAVQIPTFDHATVMTWVACFTDLFTRYARSFQADAEICDPDDTFDGTSEKSSAAKATETRPAVMMAEMPMVDHCATQSQAVFIDLRISCVIG